MQEIKHHGLVLVRNFHLLTCDIDEHMRPIGETNRLSLAIRTGTDRDDNSLLWNAYGHDHDHENCPIGKFPSGIIYAYVAEVHAHGYLVHYYPNQPESMDLTKGLSEVDGILIYDAHKLTRVSKNEHWFTSDPRDALLDRFSVLLNRRGIPKVEFF